MSGSGLAPNQTDEGRSVEGTTQLRRHEISVQRVASVPSGSTRTTVSASARSLSTITVAEGIDVLDTHPATERHDLAPGVLPAGRILPIRHVVRTGQDPEVLGVVVGQDDEPARAGVTRPGKVVDGVLDPLAAGHDHPGLRGRFVGRDGQPLRRVGAVQADQHEGPVPGTPGPEGEAPVGFFEDEDVTRRVGPQLVAPQLVGALGVVEADVEDHGRVTRPGQSVPDVGHHLGRGAIVDLVTPASTIEGAETQFVVLGSRRCRWRRPARRGRG